MEYPYYWAWSKTPVQQNCKGMRCRVLARGKKMNSCWLKFENGFEVITSRNGLRKIKPESL